MNKSLFIFCFLFFCIAICAYAENDIPAVENIRNILSFRAGASYDFVFFNKPSIDNGLYSNRPVSAGVGIGILNTVLKLSVSLPIYDHEFEKSLSYDFDIYNFSRDNRYLHLFFRYYDGFNDRNNDIDFHIINAGLSLTYILNNNHSLRAVYNLDKRQNISNGSFLFGGGLSFSSIKSDSYLLSEYSDRQNTFNFGPHLGYSYTFVFANNVFINVLSTFGLNGVAGRDSFTFEFQAAPKFSFGYHGSRWSANIACDFSYAMGLLRNNRYELMSGEVSLNFIWRIIQLR